MSKEEKQGKQLGFYTRTCTKFQVHILRIERGPSSLDPPAMFLHLVKLHRKKENSVDSAASLHVMSDSDSTPKEQEPIQNSEDPSVIMTANGTAHTTEEASVYVCDLDILFKLNF